MTASALKGNNIRQLKQLFAQLTAAVSETLGSLIAREVKARPGELQLLAADDLLAALPRANAVARGALDKDYAGHHLCVAIDMPDAVAMAGMLMLTPDELIEQRRGHDAFASEDAEAFGELGNVLCSGLGNVLRDNVANVDLRLQDHALLKPGLDEKHLLADGPLVCAELQLQVGSHPPTTARLLIDKDTADKWNQQPIEVPAATAAAAPAAARGDGSRPEDDSLDEIPAAPIRGVLNAFLGNPDPYRVLRRCCRRVGLELRRYGRSEIPNPAAHRNEVVLLDVPLGEERRFDWCRRIKDFNSGIKTVLLLHRPSRARVTQAFLAQADVILGWPCQEEQLGQKLAELLDVPTP